VARIWARHWALLVWVSLLVGCDRPAAPSANPSAKSPPSRPKVLLPSLGVIRLSPASLPADLQSEFAPSGGLPSYCAKFEYAGPRTWLAINPQRWQKGKVFSEDKGEHTMKVPMSGEIAFTMTEVSNAAGQTDIKIHETYPVESDPETGLVTHRFSTSTSYAHPSIKGLAVHTVKADLPLEIPDGKEATIWAVFVDEPPGAELSMSLEDRAKRADSAWLFKISTVEPEK